MDNDNVCKIVLLDTNEICIVDLADELLVTQYKWSTAKGRNTLYARAYIHPGSSSMVYMHHLILGGVPPNGFVVDHVNDNGLDNRRANLQVLSHGENIRKAYKGVVGVYYLKRLKSKPWRAEIRFDNHKFHLGYFATQEEAVAARTSFLVARLKEVKSLDKR